MESMPDQPGGSVEDPRWRLVNRTIRLHGAAPDSLIEILHAVQEHFGYLDRDALKYVANALQVPLSLVYGVATFYHYFTLKPSGEHACVVCQGTACYIGGATNILKKIKKDVGIEPGETTADGKISLLSARCLGSCSLAPVVVFDGKVTGRMTPETVLDEMRSWLGNDHHT